MDRYLHHFITRALNALLYARKKHKQIMFSFSTAVKPSTALFFCILEEEKKTNAKRIVSMATVDGEKRAQRKCPTVAFGAL